jgi:hypothetical protein
MATEGGAGGQFGGLNDGRSNIGSHDLVQMLVLVDHHEKPEVHPCSGLS